jgi:glycerophosphoryl diester phosphodiesterase
MVHMPVDTAHVGRPTTGFRYLDEPRGVLAFAHRGGSLHPEVVGLENTLAAFRHAVALGYTYLETDVHATRDGTLLAFHDRSLHRLTDRAGAIARLPYSEVASALVGGAHTIPQLVELMEEFPDSRFNIDIKSPGAVDPLVDVLRRLDAYDRVLVGSFTEASIRRFRRNLDRPVPTACGPRAVVATRFTPERAGAPLAALLRDDGLAFQVPHRHRGITVVTREFVRRAHAAGRHVHVWTINDPDEMHEVLDLGVDGVITDRTDLLREVLLDRGLWGGGEA